MFVYVPVCRRFQDEDINSLMHYEVKTLSLEFVASPGSRAQEKPTALMLLWLEMLPTRWATT